MRTNSSVRGSALVGMLAAALAAALLLTVCLYGIGAALNLMQTAAKRSGADALARVSARQICQELRFSRDPEAAIADLADYRAELGGMRLENLTFETAPGGRVTFSFTVGKYSYVYTVLPLNRAYDPADRIIASCFRPTHEACLMGK